MGTNIISKNSPSEIVADIMEIVDIYHKHGAKDVYISAITYRPRFEDEIMDICHKHGVKDVYISAITYRPRFEDEIINTNWMVKDVYISAITYRPRFEDEILNTNWMVKAHEIYRDFIFIENYNITKRHIWKGRVHLKDRGTTILMNNFILAINGKRTH